jgi:hypothetical protein
LIIANSGSVCFVGLLSISLGIRILLISWQMLACCNPSRRC